MRRLDVIALDEAFQQDLPVDLELALGRGEQRADPGRSAWRAHPANRRPAPAASWVTNTSPEALARRHRDQRMRLLVETREAFLVRDVAQPAFEIVGPAVIAADEGARAARCRSPPACRDAGRRCGRLGPCRRTPRTTTIGVPAASRATYEPPPAVPPMGRTARASAAGCARSPQPGAPSIGSWRPARARPPARHPSCRWRCGRARAALRTGHPLPLSFLPSRSAAVRPSIRPAIRLTKKPQSPRMSPIQAH